MGVNRNMRYTVAFILVFCMLEITHAGSRIEFKKMPCTMLQGITEREYTIYLPDDYNLSDTCTYPVLYLWGKLFKYRLGLFREPANCC